MKTHYRVSTLHNGQTCIRSTRGLICAMEAGNQSTREADAKLICDAVNNFEDMRKALQAISKLGGNLPDDRLESRTGVNDAVARGIMYTSARAIALEALNQSSHVEV